MIQALARVGALIASALLTVATASAGTDPWAPPAGYYDAATGAGATLKSQLYDRMRTGHTQRAYGDFRYSAAIHDADPANPSKIFLAYNRASVNPGWDSGSTWNREHVWPQSRQPGDASNSTRGNLGDPHALRPMNPSINSSRGNKPFGNADTTGSYRSLGTFYFVGDADRGDIARCLFYSETRYGPERGITLVNGIPSGNQMGDLASLLAWHYLDPPDEFERRRNHTISSPSYNPSYFTNNRNAFVDRPEFVWSIYFDQANDARLSVGGAPGPDGASTLILPPATVFTGDTAPTANVTLTRDGNDGVYYEIVPMPGTVSSHEGRYNAFSIDGPDTASLTIGFDGPVTAISGLVTAGVLIDNLDVTTGGGAGRGANDADDLVFLDLTVLDHAEASFNEFANLDTIEIDLGDIPLGDGVAAQEVLIFNLGGPGPLAAALDIELASVSGDDDRFDTDLDSENGLSAGDSLPVIVVLRDDVPGAFAAEYTYRVFDDRAIPGFAEGAPLTLRLIGSVGGGACPADLDANGAVDAADLASLLAAWGQPDAADLDASGSVDAADLATLLAAWGPCPTR